MSASTGLLCFILFLPGIFVEHKIDQEAEAKHAREEAVKAKSEAEKNYTRQKSLIHNPQKLLRKISSISPVDGQLLEVLDLPTSGLSGGLKPESKKSERPNWLATIASTYNFFSFLFNFVLLET